MFSFALSAVAREPSSRRRQKSQASRAFSSLFLRLRALPVRLLQRTIVKTNGLLGKSEARPRTRNPRAGTAAEAVGGRFLAGGRPDQRCSRCPRQSGRARGR